MKKSKYTKEQLIKFYMELHDKLGMTPSRSDIKNERSNNKGFPSIYHFIKHFKNMTFLAKQCNYKPNDSYYNYTYDSNENDLRTCLRNKCVKWRNDSLEKWNNKSCISDKKAKIIHHDYPFNKIIDEIFEVTNYEKSNSIKDYSDEQLKKMSDLCVELHYKYGLGYCLTSNEHMEFHSIYGYNSEGKMEEFIEYKKGHNKEIEYDNKFNLDGLNIVIYKSEMDDIIKLKELSRKQKYILFAFLIHSKIFKNENQSFYLPAILLREYYDVSTDKIIKTFYSLLQSLDLIEVKKHMFTGKSRKPNEYKFKNIFLNEGKNEFYCFTLERGNTINNYYNCLRKFYDRKYLKKIFRDKEYRYYSHY